MEYAPKCKLRIRAMVSAVKLETQTQYRVRDDQYEVLKSSTCLQEEITLLLLSLASFFTINSHALKSFFAYCPFHSFFVEKWRLWHWILDYLLYRARKKEKKRPLALQPSFTQNTKPNPNPLHFRCWMPLCLLLQRIQNKTENQGIWTVKIDFVLILCKTVPAWTVFCYSGWKGSFLSSTIFWCYYKEAIGIFSSLTSS